VGLEEIEKSPLALFSVGRRSLTRRYWVTLTRATTRTGPWREPAGATAAAAVAAARETTVLLQQQQQQQQQQQRRRRRWRRRRRRLTRSGRRARSSWRWRSTQIGEMQHGDRQGETQMTN
jgi:hypothetical protein